MKSPSQPDKTVLGIGRRLQIIRLAHDNMPQNEFAEWVGISPQAWNNYERGRRRIDLDRALLVVNKTRVTLDYIYSGDESGLPLRIATKLSPAASGAG